jgi:peptidyl-tRNA hydrolase
MSNDEDKVAVETSNSKEPATLPSKASAEDGDPTKPAHERKAVVVSAPPTKIEYKSLTEVQSSAKEEEEKEKSSVSAKAKESAQSFKGIVKSVGKKTKAITDEKTKQLKDKSAQTLGIGPQKDAHDIQNLGTRVDVEKMVVVFEDTMDEIRKEKDFKTQEKQLTSFKKLLEEQVKEINARLNVARRPKYSFSS